MKFESETHQKVHLRPYPWNWRNREIWAPPGKAATKPFTDRVGLKQKGFTAKTGTAYFCGRPYFLSVVPIRTIVV